MHRLVNLSASTTSSTSSATVQQLSKMALPVVQKVTHCVFDMDGTLLDTETLYTEAYQKALEPYGIQYTWDVKLQLMGSFGNEGAQKLVEIYKLPITAEQFANDLSKEVRIIMPKAELLPDTELIYESLVRDVLKMYNKPYPRDVRMRILGTTEQMTAKIAVTEMKLPITADEFKRKFSELGRKRLTNVPFLRGAERLIRHLHQHKIPICLATSSSKEMAEIKMKRHTELFDLFEHKVYGSTDPDVKIGKPAPDIFLVACKRFAKKPTEADCLVFEDAPNGVRAACLAGMQSIMIPDDHVPKDMREDATMVIKSLEDFQPELFGLPAFENQNEA